MKNLSIDIEKIEEDEKATSQSIFHDGFRLT